MKLRIGFLETGHYYHVYNRGVDKRIIFNDGADMLYFLTLIIALNRDERIRDIKNLLSRLQANSIADIPRILLAGELVEIHSYSLVSNHFHLVLRQITDSGISKFMMKVSAAYVRYYNMKHKRVGRLLSGPFKYTHITSKKALKDYIAYVSHNHQIHSTTQRHIFESSRSFDSEDMKYFFPHICTSVREYFVSKELFEEYSNQHVLETLHRRDHAD